MIRLMILSVVLLGVASPGQTKPTAHVQTQPAPVPPPASGQLRLEDLSPAERNEFRAAYVARRNMRSTSISSDCRKLREESDHSASGLERATNSLKCSTNGY